uniref:ubiquitinyl hydrolase 1 n=1 Tax=Anolis carolinensis TaxID=28377 RepID=A0A803T0T5_ANOCA
MQRIDWDLYYAGKHDYYPGPIDNSKLVADSETQTLKRYSIEGVDYEVIPIEAWNKLVNWYGCIERQRPIERTVVEYEKMIRYEYAMCICNIGGLYLWFMCCMIKR